MITVVIPALNESEHIASVVALAKRSRNVREVIVVDDGSVDGTPEIARAAGAKVITGKMLGKGGSMEDGMEAASENIIAYLDGDLHGLCEDLVDRLCAPLLAGEADFVKAKFSRAAGRVTVLTAKPLLQIFFPDIAHFAQPLGGIMAARKEVLESLSFEADYGVDLGLLIDAAEAGWKLAEVDIGHLEHESQTLERLGDMAKQVVRTLLLRADKLGKLSGSRLTEVEEVERIAQSELTTVLGSLGRVRRLALFDMDGTLIRGRFITALAQNTGRSKELWKWLDNLSVTDAERSWQIAQVFKGVPKDVFERTARELPLVNGAMETIVTLRKLGFRVGIVSDSFRIATEIVRRRVYADFSVSNIIRFRDGIASGEVEQCPIWSPPEPHSGCLEHEGCKGNAVRHLTERLGIRRKYVVAVGDSRNDICMFGQSGLAVAFEPKGNAVRDAAQHAISGDMRSLVPLITDGDSKMKIRPSLVTMAQLACAGYCANLVRNSVFG